MTKSTTKERSTRLFREASPRNGSRQVMANPSSLEGNKQGRDKQPTTAAARRRPSWGGTLPKIPGGPPRSGSCCPGAPGKENKSERSTGMGETDVCACVRVGGLAGRRRGRPGKRLGKGAAGFREITSSTHEIREHNEQHSVQKNYPTDSSGGSRYNAGVRLMPVCFLCLGQGY